VSPLDKSKKRPARARRAPKNKNRSAKARCFAVAAPGLSAVLATELKDVVSPLDDVEVTPEGVAFTTNDEGLWAANLCSRLATRILVRLGSFKAQDFPTLRREAAGLPFADFIRHDQDVKLEVACSRCRLYHSGAVAERVQQALEESLGRSIPAQNDGARPVQRIYVRGVSDRFTVSVDSSGELLHKRGYRSVTGRAPLRETLAAGVLALANWKPGESLIDPMCGAGTLAIEAAAKAQGHWPGAQRRFAFESWPDERREKARGWARLKRSRLSKNVTLAAPGGVIAACDHDAQAVARAVENCTAAGLEGHLDIFQSPLRAVRPPTDTGLLVANPPYGKRIGRGAAASEAYAELGAALRGPFARWRAAVLVPSVAAARALALEPQQTIPLNNGGLRIQLLLFKAHHAMNPEDESAAR